MHEHVRDGLLDLFLGLEEGERWKKLVDLTLRLLRELNVEPRDRRPLDPLRNLHFLISLVVIVGYIRLDVKDGSSLYDVNPTEVKRSPLHPLQLAQRQPNGVGPMGGAGGKQALPSAVEARRMNECLDGLVAIVVKEKKYPHMRKLGQSNERVLRISSEQNRDRALGRLSDVPLPRSPVLLKEARRHIPDWTQTDDWLTFPDDSSSLHVRWDRDWFRSCAEDFGDSQVLGSCLFAGKPVAACRQELLPAAGILLSQ
mmetsp:Transcript_35904/g.112311  ORF Transcript_35904/g.112311 Transcript_35904/m.112311 type:complete len:256 (+) Transcript_35904:2962-3729(+)